MVAIMTNKIQKYLASIGIHGLLTVVDNLVVSATLNLRIKRKIRYALRDN